MTTTEIQNAIYAATIVANPVDSDSTPCTVSNKTLLVLIEAAQELVDDIGAQEYHEQS